MKKIALALGLLGVVFACESPQKSENVAPLNRSAARASSGAIPPTSGGNGTIVQGPTQIKTGTLAFQDKDIRIGDTTRVYINHGPHPVAMLTRAWKWTADPCMTYAPDAVAKVTLPVGTYDIWAYTTYAHGSFGRTHRNVVVKEGCERFEL
ncbi:hypothetical protein [Larkinella soli]|uniref:hypothetical protein n=1 Tax=Larkinella soli TaxID=1770527 RepID=UPI000FFB7A57|nr:hypothetical protein [Larkinella soli]